MDYYYGDSGTVEEVMPEHLSNSELERMRKFAETPVYKREPEQLLPPAAEESK